MIAITTGDSPTLGRATAMMATSGRSDEAPATTGKGRRRSERDRDPDPRWTDRDGNTRDRDPDVRDAFTRHVHLPRGRDRELVHDRDRE
jgi:hypothetical protein